MPDAKTPQTFISATVLLQPGLEATSGKSSPKPSELKLKGRLSRSTELSKT